MFLSIKSYFYDAFIVKLHSNLQTQLNFSWLELELTLFPLSQQQEEQEQE